MKPLIVLISVFSIAWIVLTLIGGYQQPLTLSARIAMSVMLCFTSTAHFFFVKGMTMMIPNSIPFKQALIYITGILEIMAAIGLLLPGFRILAAWLLILMFLCLLPANIYAAINHIDYQKGDHTGKGLPYLWFRVPLQLLFIAWVYFSCIAAW
jgi:uncharacterized membrane protein